MNDIWCQYYEEDGPQWLIHVCSRVVDISCHVKGVHITIAAASEEAAITYEEESILRTDAELTEGHFESDQCTLVIGTKVCREGEAAPVYLRTGWAELNGRGLHMNYNIPYRVALIVQAIAQGRTVLDLFGLGVKRAWPGEPIA
jgi:hypothetical protein